jgi:alpha-galactosidase
MEFNKHEGLSFKIGPTAVNVLRVIEPDETIKTPAVHLGIVKGDFDETVQAMHEHIRRSVLPSGNPRRRYPIQHAHAEDQPLSIYRGKEFTEQNVKKAMDVAAAIGAEVFDVDGPTWCSTYGNWLAPKEKLFPNGLGPLVKKLGPAEQLQACYEAGPTGYALYWQLSGLGVK